MKKFKFLFLTLSLSTGISLCAISSIALKGKIESKAGSGDVYQIASKIESGDEVVIVSNENDKIAGVFNASYLEAEDASFSADPKKTSITSLTETASHFIVEVSTSNALEVAFKLSSDDSNNNKYLWHDGKALSFVGTTSYWTVSIDEEYLDADISDGDYSILYNTDSPRFKTYNSSQAGTSMGCVQLYKKSEAVAEILSVSFDSPTFDIFVDEIKELKANVNAIGEIDRSLTYELKDVDPAECLLYDDKTFEVYAFEAGTATLLATSVADPSKSASIKITSTVKPVYEVKEDVSFKIANNDTCGIKKNTTSVDEVSEITSNEFVMGVTYSYIDFSHSTYLLFKTPSAYLNNVSSPVNGYISSVTINYEDKDQQVDNAKCLITLSESSLKGVQASGKWNNPPKKGGYYKVDNENENYTFFNVSTNKAVKIKNITVTFSPKTTLTQKVEKFINDYMHLDDYNESLGYCLNTSSPDKQFYRKAKEALLNLEDLYGGIIEEFKTNDSFTPAYNRYLSWANFNNDSKPFEKVSTSTSDVYQINKISLIIPIASVGLTLLSILGISLFIISKKKRA